MIVNLAESTRQIIKNAALEITDINHVTFYNVDDEQYQRCSFAEFMETAEDINYEELDPLMANRPIINTDLEIVADTWFLRRTYDGEEGERWILNFLPKADDELYDGDGEFHSDYVIADDDIFDPHYVEMVKPEHSSYEYAQDSTIDILGVSHDIVNLDGIQKVIESTGNVLIVKGYGYGEIWTRYVDDAKYRPELMYHPRLIKHVMEHSSMEPLTFNNEILKELTGVEDAGYPVPHDVTLHVIAIPRGSEFSIDIVEGQEVIVYRDELTWFKA